jgi:copper chaperone
MTAFEVNDMTCGHCVATITNAVKGVDASADIKIDLPARLVAINSSRADATTLANTIKGAGFHPLPVSAERRAPWAAASGCCCSGR